MIIFQYRREPAMYPYGDDEFFELKVDYIEDNNISVKDYGDYSTYTLPKSALLEILQLIQTNPKLIKMENLEQNDNFDGEEYEFLFCDGLKSNKLFGFNIFDYNEDTPHPRVMLCMETLYRIVEILGQNSIDVTIKKKY
ncbi:hypothetical protein IJS18_00155 [Candidatus Saccharibacteria bacterium]|nr:hypothetical protein [Candidatus Saccharibacteria bacterium]